MGEQQRGRWLQQECLDNVHHYTRVGGSRSAYGPSSEKMKPNCDMEVKKSKSEVMLVLHFS